MLLRKINFLESSPIYHCKLQPPTLNHIFIKIALSLAFCNFMWLFHGHERKYEISSLFLIQRYTTQCSKLGRKLRIFFSNDFYIPATDVLNSVELVSKQQTVLEIFYVPCFRDTYKKLLLDKKKA